MKLIRNIKIALVSLMFLGIAVTSNAQEVGIRFGNNWNNNVAIDAIFGAGKYSRIHADLSFGHGVSAEALWDFVYRPLGSDGINWYAGVGLSTFFGSTENSDNTTDDSDFQLGIPGEIGLEYRFRKAPLALGIDWRPVFVIVDNTSFSAGEFGVNFRYVFGK